MTTTAQKFYPHTTDHDDTWGTDARKLNDVDGHAIALTTIANFETDGAVATIVLDPYSTVTRSTDPAEDAVGWAINKTGGDGMGATSTVYRTIPSGTWGFRCRAAATIAQTGIGSSSTKITAVVFKVSSAGARTELFRSASAATAVLLTATVVVWTSASQSAIEFATNETLLVSYQFESVGIIVTGQQITFITVGDNPDADDVWFTVPSPGVRDRVLKAVTGSTTPAGAMVRSPTKLLTASTTPAGVIVRKPSRLVAGSTSPVGAVLKKPSIFSTGSTTPAGAVLRRPTKLLTGTVTPGPSTIVRKPTKLLTATITPAATVSKFVARFFTGSTTPTGQVLKRPGILMGGTVTPGPGAVTRRPTKLLTGTVTSSGTLRTLITKNLTAAITPVGTLTRRVSKFFTGSTTPAGSVRKTPKKFLTGTIGTQTGGTTIIRRIIRIFED